jgi:hypothetical protein
MSNDNIDIWTVYDHPRDFPEKYVGRLHVIGRLGSEPTDHVIVADTLEEIRAMMMAKGLFCLTRHPDDDPVIVEVWL